MLKSIRYLLKSLRESPYPWGKRRMDYCVWMRIPAKSRRNPTNPDKIGTQPAKKNRKNQQKSIVKFLKKIWSGRASGASGIGPGPSRNAPERRKRKKTISGRKRILIGKPSGAVFCDFCAWCFYDMVWHSLVWKMILASRIYMTYFKKWGAGRPA